MDFPQQPGYYKGIIVTMQIDTVGVFSDYQSKALHLRRRESDYGDRESDSNHAA